tara:strand:- start:352 stop:513 length:162 start_codon:yes stop_codon:yes gene_type:complete
VGDTDSLLIEDRIVYNRLIPGGFLRDKCGYLTDELADGSSKKEDNWYLGNESE